MELFVICNAIIFLGFNYSGYVSGDKSVAEYYKASKEFILEQENWQQLFTG